jgi:triacylglycerol lipase
VMGRGTGQFPRVVDGGHALFVHGFMAHGAVFGPLREHVEKTTGRGTSEVSYTPLERFEVVAERVARAIEAVPGSTPIAAVGHSLGGLLLRWAIQELGVGHRVDRLVTLATPHAGTHAARIGVVPLAAALRPGSPVLVRLEGGKHRAAHIRHVALVAERDRMIRPVASAAMPGAEVHWMPELGHNEMLFDRAVWERVAGVLAEPQRDEPVANEASDR